jgi:hypothetical protein
MGRATEHGRGDGIEVGHGAECSDGAVAAAPDPISRHVTGRVAM